MAAFVYGCLKHVVPPIVTYFFAPKGVVETDVMSQVLVGVFNGVLPQISELLAGVLLVIWGVSLFHKHKRRALLACTYSGQRLRALSWQEFEHVIGEYYRQQGFSVEERGGPQPDGGVDIILRKGGRTTLVQCKHWKKQQVGVREARELLGVVHHERADQGILVTSGDFTVDARAFAATNPIAFLNGETLQDMFGAIAGRMPALKEANREIGAPVNDGCRSSRSANLPIGSSATPACPQCASPMVIRTSGKGSNAGAKFYGCPRFPTCRGTVNIA